MSERRLRWIVRIGVLLVRVLGWSWRVRWIDDGPVRAHVARGEPLIYAIWHGQLLPLLFAHRGQGIFALISEHRDGEIIARIVERLGFRTIRGSTSRGAARALVSIVGELRAGHRIAITPDGPRGPAREFAPGALIAAQRAGAPIVAVAMHASRAWQLKSWDRFTIPKPFARVVVAYSAIESVDADSPRAATELAPRFQAILNATCERVMP